MSTRTTPRIAIWSLARTLAMLGLIAASARARGGDSDAIIPGFAASSATAERASEAKAVAIPSPKSARDFLLRLTEEPHVAGTPADRKTAEFVRDKLAGWGWDAEIVEYQVLLNYPRPESIMLSIVRPDPRNLLVTEEPFGADKDSASPDAWPAFHGYGASGLADGQVIYANYGRPEDFEALDKLGVPVDGKIVLVRYGGLFRGLKILNAQKRGAIGVLIYSDPADDGYAKGDVYPDGPYRPGSAIQRGSVQFLSLGPGDPSTPNGPSTADAPRLPIDKLNGFPNDNDLGQVLGSTAEEVKEWEEKTGLSRLDYFAAIPSLPISYDSARPILEAMGGQNVPEGAQGGLPFAYHTGPGPVEVRFHIGMDYAVRPIWNVIAKLEGSEEPDRWVMLGNHRDAWTYGAVDPSSGTAATLETCRALGEAVKAGWEPRRTIMYASWDAEEYGLVGSTEWAEDHAEELSEKAALMLNVDAAVGGPDLSAGGVPSLVDLFRSAAADLTDPRTGEPLLAAWTSRQRKQWSSRPVALNDGPWRGEAAGPRSIAPFAPKLEALGSGSDYTAFVDHLGIPALDVDFGGHYGVYHSIYDNFFWMEKFGDPEFLTHATAARLYTLIMMRAAAAEVVPLTFSPYAEAIREQVDDLRRLVESKSRASGTTVDFPGLPDLIDSAIRFEEAAAGLDRASTRAAGLDDFRDGPLASYNDALIQVERAFLLPDGLPGRPWFRHAIYAPGLTTGYESWPLPGPRQAIIQDDADLLADQVDLLVERLDAASEAMRTASALVPDGDK